MEENDKNFLTYINSMPLNIQNVFYNNPILKHGGLIKIKPSQKGSFTEYCGGKVTQSCINKAKKSSSKAIKKKAVFAENARKWNKK